jgi:imidazolonepropionase-like amidohydrolase
MLSLPAVLIVVFGVLWIVTPLQAHAGTLKALVGGVLIDGTGAAPLSNSVILIDGERIVAVGKQGTVVIPDTAQIISTAGLTVLPGLWDLSVHLSRLGHLDTRHWDELYLALADRVVMPLAAKQLLQSGVTSARDVASPLGAALSVRDRINTQRIPGPTLYIGGPALDKKAAPSMHAYRWQIQGAMDAQQKAQRLANAGVDYLLVTNPAALAPAELEAIARVAYDSGIPWNAEISGDEDIAVALAHNASGLLGVGLDLHPSLPATAATVLGARAASNEAVPWVAGASLLTNYSWLRHNLNALDALPWNDGLPAIVTDDIRTSLNAISNTDAVALPAERRAVVGSRLASARAMGARLLVGSDSGMPGHFHTRAVVQEIDALVTDAGLSPLEAIRAATLDAARLMKAANDNGSIETGKYADIIAVKGDVLQRISALHDIELVMRHGLRQR